MKSFGINFRRRESELVHGPLVDPPTNVTANNLRRGSQNRKDCSRVHYGNQVLGLLVTRSEWGSKGSLLLSGWSLINESHH